MTYKKLLYQAITVFAMTLLTSLSYGTTSSVNYTHDTNGLLADAIVHSNPQTSSVIHNYYQANGQLLAQQQIGAEADFINGVANTSLRAERGNPDLQYLYTDNEGDVVSTSVIPAKAGIQENKNTLTPNPSPETGRGEPGSPIKSRMTAIYLYTPHGLTTNLIPHQNNTYNITHNHFT